MGNDIQHYKDLFFLSEEEMALLKTAGQQLTERNGLHLVTEEFKEFMRNAHDDYNLSDDVINGVESIKEALWSDIVTNPANEGFLEQQRQFGTVFIGLGVPYEGYVAAIASYYSIVVKHWKNEDLVEPGLLYAFKKVESIQTIIIEEVYRYNAERALREQNEALNEMSTPVTQLWDGILLLPLVGYIDSKRAQDTMTIMLDMIAKTQAKVFILDISGVAVVDTAVANYLIRITKATRLMGCTCLISGISGSVAQTIVELGIQIDEVTTTGTMKEALNHSLRVTGAEVVKLTDEYE